MKILITGATGIVGTEIMKLCAQKGIFIHYLSTSKTKIQTTATAQGFYWNPATQEIDNNCLKGIDAVINLAGASISKRWTKTYKAEISSSRVKAVKLLYILLSENEHHVKTVVSASAIGIYPSSFSTVFDETSTALNDSFLGKVVRSWETEVNTLSSLGLSVCKLRLGIVLSKQGGALAKMVQPIRLGFGSALASGKQGQSWIHNTDLAQLFLFAIEHSLIGIYNAVASDVVTNTIMTKTIAQQLKKPLWLPNIPAFVLKTLLGEMATLVLESQQVSNAKILKTGFVFEFDNLKKTLKDCL